MKTEIKLTDDGEFLLREGTTTDGDVFRDNLLDRGEIDGWDIVIWSNAYGEPYATAYDEMGREYDLAINTRNFTGGTYDWLGQWPRHPSPMAGLRRLAALGSLRCENTILLPGGSSLGCRFI